MHVLLQWYGKLLIKLLEFCFALTYPCAKASVCSPQIPAWNPLLSQPIAHRCTQGWHAIHCYPFMLITSAISFSPPPSHDLLQLKRIPSSFPNVAYLFSCSGFLICCSFCLQQLTYPFLFLLTLMYSSDLSLAFISSINPSLASNTELDTLVLNSSIFFFLCFLHKSPYPLYLVLFSDTMSSHQIYFLYLFNYLKM